MYFFRALTVFLTVLPAPEDRPHCKYGIQDDCNDFLYSGHTIFNVVTSYFIGYPIWATWDIL